MSNTITITVPNPQSIADTYGLNGDILLQRATSKGGSYANLTTIGIDDDETTYIYVDTTGTAGHWYRYRFQDSTVSIVSEYSDPFPGRTPTSKTLQYVRKMLAKEMGMFDEGTSTAAVDVNNLRDSTKVSSLRSSDSYKGAFLLLCDGALAGTVVRVASFAESTGTFTYDRALSGSIADGVSYHIFRWCHPSLLTEAINDALGVLVHEDSFVLSGIQGRYEYSLPYWIERKSDILSLQWMTGQGVTLTENANAIWNPWGGGGFDVKQKNGENVLIFDTARGDNQVFRAWALRPYVADYDDRLSAESDTITAPLDQLLIGAKMQAYDRMAAAAGPGEAAQKWERERDKILPSWMVVQRRQRGYRSQPVRGQNLEQWVV